ncbi:MAG TPA: Na+/H+ antiporter subunit E [Steroidobacteraceae bacterium]|nr:Na+/H+ antiporter subunit E [Steroidobacteraceae bacterium]
MKRGQAHISPTLVVALTALWLLLNQTLAPAHILLGVVLAVAMARFGSKLRPLQARMRRADVAARLVIVVLWDIIASNLHVALIVLGVVRREIRSGFLRIPLELRDPHGLAGLAMIVTATPGTVWAGLSDAGDVLTLHVLDLRDEAGLIQSIKQRYEQPLMRIFE